MFQDVELNRRSLLQTSGALAASSLFLSTRTSSAAPTAKITETKVISSQANKYHGWPTLTRTSDGELLVVCSGGREAHVCPFGRVELIRSKDEGKTWSHPRVLLDGPIDERDAGVMQTAKGSLLVTTFTSLAYEPLLTKSNTWPTDKRRRWEAVHNRITDTVRKNELGTWMIRSTDRGVTWSARYDCKVNSPHGPIQLADGRLLYAGKELWKEPHRIGVSISKDDGETWGELTPIPTRKGDDHKQYHELHAVEDSDGRIVVQIRNHNRVNAGETLQSQSTDGGKTWSEPKSIGVWGLPSYLTRLSDGRLLMSYGHRRKPYGNQARISTDHGQTWSEPLTISGDGIGGDLGYPSTAQLDDGSLVTVWYERIKGSTHAVLRQAKWKLTD